MCQSIISSFFVCKSNCYFTVCRITLFYKIDIDVAVDSDKLRGNTRYSFMIFWQVNRLSIKVWITDHKKLPEITYRNVTITAKAFVQREAHTFSSKRAYPPAYICTISGLVLTSFSITTCIGPSIMMLVIEILRCGFNSCFEF